MSETPWVPGSTDEASSDAGTDFKPITTQEEFEQRIKGRLNKQASKFSDYEEVKAVAQDAQQRITQLQQELESERFVTVRNTVASIKVFRRTASAVTRRKNLKRQPKRIWLKLLT